MTSLEMASQILQEINTNAELVMDKSSYYRILTDFLIKEIGDFTDIWNDPKRIGIITKYDTDDFEVKGSEDGRNIIIRFESFEECEAFCRGKGWRPEINDFKKSYFEGL